MMIYGFSAGKTFICLVFLLAEVMIKVAAFVVTSTQCQVRPYDHAFRTVTAMTNHDISPSTFAMEYKMILSSPEQFLSSSLLVSDSTEIVTNVLIGVGGIAVVVLGLLNVILPYAIMKIADLVEDMAKELDPSLLVEYEQELNRSKSMAERLEILQKLANKVYALDEAKDLEASNIDAQRETSSTAEIAQEQPPQSTSTSSNTPSTQSGIDIEITSKNKWDD
jgi:hypothetical protein